MHFLNIFVFLGVFSNFHFFK